MSAPVVDEVAVSLALLDSDLRAARDQAWTSQVDCLGASKSAERLAKALLGPNDLDARDLVDDFGALVVAADCKHSSLVQRIATRLLVALPSIERLARA